MADWRFETLLKYALLASVWFVAIVGVSFLYVPIAVVIIYSFSADSLMSFPLHGVTLHWYAVLFRDEQLQVALGNSLIVAAVSVVIGLFFGIPAAFALERYRFFGKQAIELLLVLPFVLPGVLFGLALLLLYLELHLSLSLVTVILGHATLLIVVTIVVVRNGLKRWDRTLEEAAMDLGANELQTFLLVILPNIRSSLIGAILLGVTLSLDEIVRTFFWTGTDNTLPTFVWSMLRFGITPEINAAASIIFLLSAGAIIVIARYHTRLPVARKE